MHLNKFFQIVVSQITISVLRFFNFVITSRLNNEIDSNYFDYLTSFLRFKIYRDLSNNIITSFIVFNILLNVYFLKMHRKYYINILKITN